VANVQRALPSLASEPRSGRRPVILLTGFGPFPSVPVNATTLLVPELAERVARRFRSHAVVPHIVPTEWAAGPDAATTLLADHAPAIVLHFGVSSRARGFEIELTGRNHRAAAADACGEIPPTPSVIEGAPRELYATIPAARIVARLKRLGLPAFLSRDAGTYLCNSLLFRSLHAARELRLATCSGFVHLPDALVRLPRRRRGASACPLDWDQAVDGAVEIVAACIGTAGRSAPFYPVDTSVA
jgi:pyroglutamyl-peptidase